MNARDAFISLKKAIQHINENYDVNLEDSSIVCCFSEKNEQCIKERCPFYKKPNRKVAFICIHNSCRSQIAEALGKHLTSTQVDEEAQHFYRKLGYKDCGGFVIDVSEYEQPMEMFFIKRI